MPRKNRQIPHQKQQFITGCQGKRRFKTQQEARSAADDQMLMQPSLELRIYRCDFCHQWHLTRQVNRYNGQIE